ALAGPPRADPAHPGPLGGREHRLRRVPQARTGRRGAPRDAHRRGGQDAGGQEGVTPHHPSGSFSPPAMVASAASTSGLTSFFTNRTLASARRSWKPLAGGEAYTVLW